MGGAREERIGEKGSAIGAEKKMRGPRSAKQGIKGRNSEGAWRNKGGGLVEAGAGDLSGLEGNGGEFR